MKKYILPIIILFTIALSLSQILNVYAVDNDTGCCINPGIDIQFICRDFLVEEIHCCPDDLDADGNPNYDTVGNVHENGPRDKAGCIADFFISDGNSCGVDRDSVINECFSPGCCCISGEGVAPDDIKHGEALCTGEGSVFIPGDHQCDECEAPECNDNEDNDCNGCWDFYGGTGTAPSNADDCRTADAGYDDLLTANAGRND